MICRAEKGLYICQCTICGINKDQQKTSIYVAPVEIMMLPVSGAVLFGVWIRTSPLVWWPHPAMMFTLPAAFLCPVVSPAVSEIDAPPLLSFTKSPKPSPLVSFISPPKPCWDDPVTMLMSPESFPWCVVRFGLVTSPVEKNRLPLGPNSPALEDWIATCDRLQYSGGKDTQNEKF